MKLIQVNRGTYPILVRMMNYYMNEIYDYIGDIEMDQEGNYIYGDLEAYLHHRDLKAFLIQENGGCLGFLLLNQGRFVPHGYDYSIHEFYVAKPYRKMGVAEKILKALFSYYKGKYFVTQLEKNIAAIRFWHHYYERHEIAYVEKRKIIDGEVCLAQTFLII